MKRKSHPLITKGILILLSLILLIFISSYAWFSNVMVPVQAEGLSAKTAKGSDFEVAVGFYSSETGEYLTTEFTKDAINLKHLIVGEDEDAEEYSIYDNWSPKDLSSDGYTIIRPGLKNSNKEVKVDPFSYTEPTPGKEYLVFDFIFKADTSDEISLASQSFAKAFHEQAVADGGLIPSSWQGRDDKSEMGNFSVDAIVGSLRVSFDPYNLTGASLTDVMNDCTTRLVPDTADSYGASCVWIPRPDLFLEQTDQDGKAFKLNTNVDSSRGTYVHKFWPKPIGGEETTESVTFPQNKTLIGSANTHGATTVRLSSDQNVHECPICTSFLQNGDSYYGKVRVFIWTEGEDSEAKKAVVGGQYYISMDLSQG
ncbi:MAG: hypothetical protein KBS62_07400 [Oscillospiraceae bacterium]|nr:hypothetical protein [Candidatus Ruminococcus equi]